MKHRELPGGGTLRYEVDTDDVLLRETLEGAIEAMVKEVRADRSSERDAAFEAFTDAVTQPPDHNDGGE